MEKKTHIIRGILFISFLLVFTSSYSQKFDWYSDGYTKGGGIFKNIDNSGIDINISGLYKESKSTTDPNAIKTGINNQDNAGFTHTYNFDFSEFVDVEFTIQGIDRDSGLNECWNDQLFFLPSPTFGKASLVTINGDTIFALRKQITWGEVTVKYSKIKNFSIKHGSGIGCNPGYIWISSLRINDDILSVNRNHQGPYFMNKVTDNSLSINGLNSLVRKVKFINAKGQLIQPNFEICSSESISIETFSLIEGVYYVFVEFDSGQAIKEKVIILH